MKAILIDVAALDQHTILIPPTLSERYDICGDTKILFANAITECTRNMYKAEINRYVKEAVNHVKAYALDFEITSISKMCNCSLQQGEKIKAEMLMLSETLNIEKCFYELGLQILNN